MARSDSHATGILLIDKPRGMSSHAVVARVRKWFGTRKVGHAGTLDPMATGLLVLGLGKGTKLLTYIVGATKSYEAVIRLGASTPTDDADSVPDTFAPAGAVAALDITDLQAAMSLLIGNIEQVPSAVSAIKVSGQRAYARVRAGEDVKLKARPVTVSRFEITGPLTRVSVGGRDFVDVPVSVDCSSGTYVRALARDVGATLGVYGHLSYLRRTRVGSFDVAKAWQLPTTGELTSAEATPSAAVDAQATAGQTRVEPPGLLSLGRVATALMPYVCLNPDQARTLLQGQFLRAAALELPAGADNFAGMLSGASAQTEPVLVAVLTRVGGEVKVATGFADVQSMAGPPLSTTDVVVF